MTALDRSASMVLFSACLLAWAPSARLPGASAASARQAPPAAPARPEAPGAPTVPARPEAPGASSRPSAPAKPERPSAPPPVSVLLVGDSLMATALGQQIEVTLAAIPGVKVHRLARSATGLARPDRHDWQARGAAATKRHAPDFVVVLIGSNDGQDIAPLPSKGRRPRAVHWGDPGWPAAYRERVLGLLRSLGAPERPVLWLGLPPMRSHSLERKLALVRKEQRAAVLSLGERHQYVGLFALVRELRDQSPVKAQKALFTADGVHFSLKGAIRFMPLVRPLLFPWVARAMVLSRVRQTSRR